MAFWDDLLGFGERVGNVVSNAAGAVADWLGFGRDGPPPAPPASMSRIPGETGSFAGAPSPIAQLGWDAVSGHDEASAAGAVPYRPLADYLVTPVADSGSMAEWPDWSSRGAGGGAPSVLDEEVDTCNPWNPADWFGMCNSTEEHAQRADLAANAALTQILSGQGRSGGFEAGAMANALSRLANYLLDENVPFALKRVSVLDMDQRLRALALSSVLKFLRQLMGLYLGEANVQFTGQVLRSISQLATSDPQSMYNAVAQRFRVSPAEALSLVHSTSLAQADALVFSYTQTLPTLARQFAALTEEAGTTA